MSELSHLFEFKAGEFTRGQTFGTPQVQAAYRLLLQGDADEAEKRFRHILQQTPKDHEAMSGLAVCVAELGGKFISAERLAKQAVRLNKKSAAGYIALGYIYLRGSRLDEGYRYLMKAKHLAPGDPRLAAGFAIYDHERPPVVSDLSRTHPVNRVLGGARVALRSPTNKAAAAAVVAYGIYWASNVLT